MRRVETRKGNVREDPYLRWTDLEIRDVTLCCEVGRSRRKSNGRCDLVTWGRKERLERRACSWGDG